ELAPLSVRRRRSGGEGGGLVRVCGLGSQQEPRLGWRRGRLSGHCRIANPDQDRARLITGELFRLDEVGLHVFEILVIQSKTAFERTIGEPLVPLEQVEDLCQYLIKVHPVPSLPCAVPLRPYREDNVVDQTWIVPQSWANGFSGVLGTPILLRQRLQHCF